MAEATLKRPVFQSYPRPHAVPTPENPFPNASSAAVAILANNPNWRPPYAAGKGPVPRLADSEAGLNSYIDALAWVESRSGRNLRNPNSNARGPFQLTPAKARELGVDLDRYETHEPAIRELEVSRDMALLKAKGFAPTNANLYALHWAGRTGGARILGADDRAPITEVIGDTAIDGNGLTREMTVGDLKAWLAKNGALDSVPAGVRIPTPPPSPILSRPADQGWPASMLDLIWPQLR